MLLCPLEQERLIVRRLLSKASLQLKEEGEDLRQDKGLSSCIAMVKEYSPDERLKGITIDVRTTLTSLSPDLEEPIKPHLLCHGIVHSPLDNRTTALAHLALIPMGVLTIEVVAHRSGKDRVTEEL